MAQDPELRAHREWIGLVQPSGLLVTPHALANAQAHVDRNVAEAQSRLAQAVVTRPATTTEDERPVVEDIRRLCIDVLGWQDADLVEPPGELSTTLAEFGETLRPTWAVPDADAPGRWLMLIVQAPEACDLDAPEPGTERRWHASPQARLERLLRETKVPIGLLVNGTAVRLVYAPSGETSGHATFPVGQMLEVWGRPMLSALLMLLHADRVFAGEPKRRLAAILQQSRKHQNEVSTRLSEQVLRALNELLRGMSAADEASRGTLLATYKDEALDLVYEGLLTVLLRLVFVLYAEDRGLTPSDATWTKAYSLTGLFERLREDEARNPDTMDQRFGAWSQLLTLFRMLHDGASHGSLTLPRRHGRLFDPDAHPFLEGRPRGVARVLGEPITPPAIPDGVVLRVLRDLLILDEERLSYRSLDVEEIGSIYQALMGFELRIAEGRAIGLKAGKKRLAIVVDLDALLAAEPGKRGRLLEDRADVKLAGKALDALKKATSIDSLMEALERRRSPTTPDVIPRGGLFLEPTEERRRSGAHYTPRSLTAPIVETTMRPIFERLGPDSSAEQVLDLKVCDPAMGSGAFLVEACRVLGDRLRVAWTRHGIAPRVPPDEDLDLYARRLVAQRCLYGVDKNPMAVDLAKLSLWLATLAKDHPFTFLDHALRCGDSLVGLSREQIEDFHWQAQPQLTSQRQRVREAVARAMEARQGILALAESDDMREKEELLAESEKALADVRLIGDVVIEAFFAESKGKARKKRLQESAELVERWLEGREPRMKVEGRAEGLRTLEHPVTPFHWSSEFPEVFGRENGGFDAFVGNPPFMGGKAISGVLSSRYLDWLHATFVDARGQVDLVALFLRQSFTHLRSGGTLGEIATKTIAIGDTRRAGLYWIRSNDGWIYSAVRRIPWPGEAAVTASALCIARTVRPEAATLDGKPCAVISAFLVDGGPDADPVRLAANVDRAFMGYYNYSPGFLFMDDSEECESLATMHALIASDRRNAERIFPMLGGEAFLNDPAQRHTSYAIDFGTMTLAEAGSWPDLLSIIERRVRPAREACRDERLRTLWWQFGRPRPALRHASIGCDRLLMHPYTSTHLAFGFVPTTTYVASPHYAFVLESNSAFAVLQSRAHDLWAWRFAGARRDDLSYTASDCFETFPFPPAWETNARLEEIGREYYEYRAKLMVEHDEGLTKTYNRFHDPDERDPSILKLRDLHAAMDRAVLDAYGWTDVPTTCEFIPDYEEEDDDGNPVPKSIRLRWPDAVRDDVLARLLALNQERAEQERLSSLTTPPSKRRRPRKRPDSDPTLFD